MAVVMRERACVHGVPPHIVCKTCDFDWFGPPPTRPEPAPERAPVDNERECYVCGKVRHCERHPPRCSACLMGRIR
jgi:hypothetical protein